LKRQKIKEKQSMLGIRDILVRIRIPGTVSLENISGSGSDSFLH
jgi:hypothetical protein